MSSAVRVLLLADSHIGFDLPVHPRSGRRRRGYDFLANYAAALQPAMNDEVDLVVHAGDVFDRSSVVPALAYQAYEPLRKIADRGTPVFIVPGNHERSRLPQARFAAHPRIHGFDRPRTFAVEVRGRTVALSGFPYERNDVRASFGTLVEETGWQGIDASLRLLCIHHCVEGATVGPGDFTFTTASDVIRARDIPSVFCAVLSGHIHRHQVLITDLERRPIRAPVLYPGSIERTSFAEMDEPKGFMVVRLAQDAHWEFRRLPARPMHRHALDADQHSAAGLDVAIRAIVDAAPSDAVISIRISGQITDAQWRACSAAHLRSFVPTTMNLEISPVERFSRRESVVNESATPSQLQRLRRGPDDGMQLSLY